MVVAICFWVLIGLLIYSYFGYTMLLALILAGKRVIHLTKRVSSTVYSPNVTIVVAAFNEEKNIADKVQNSLQQDYPNDKITQIWVNDASTDTTSSLLAEYPYVTVLNHPERKGKIAAINLAMQYVKTPITIFSDANAMLSKNAISKLVEPFSNQTVGCVAGEKRIMLNTSENAAAIGEGIYWKYESFIKRLESDCHSTLSATGELYAIRTELFETVESDTILDDFAISTNILKKGLLVKYTPEAYATERASANIVEEKKRKVRIAAGSFQALLRNKALLNPFKYPFLSLQFFSHKLLRWIVLPISLASIPILNLFIIALNNRNIIYIVTLYVQLLILIAIVLGWILKNKHISVKWIFIPYYLFMMNIAIVQGFFRFVRGTQSVKWDKSLRQT